MKRILKKLMLLFIGLFLLVGCEGKLLEYTELDESKLKANEKYVMVKWLYEEKIKYSDSPKKIKGISNVWEYDKKGRPIKMYRYNKKREKELEEEWEYNNEGRRVYYRSSGYSERLEYDKAGREKKRNVRWGDEKIDTEYWKDENSVKKLPIIINNVYRIKREGIKREKIVKRNGSINIIEYDKKGEVISSIYSSPRQKEDAKTKFERTYYKNGKKKKEIIKIVHNGEVIKKEIREYDKRGDKILDRTPKGGMVVSWYEYEYNDDGNSIKFISKDKDGEIEYWKEYKRDKKGNRIEEKEYKIDKKTGEVYIYDWTEYKYDLNGDKAVIIEKTGSGEIRIISKGLYKKIKIER